MTPYREAPPSERSSPSQSLECTIADGDKWAWFRSVFVKMWITIIAAFFANMFHVIFAALAGLVGIVWMFGDLYRRNGKRVVFRTDAGRLEVGTRVPIDIPLSKLLDVRLDTKAVKKSLMVARADGLNTPFGGAIKVFLRNAGWLPLDERPIEDRPKKKKKKAQPA